MNKVRKMQTAAGGPLNYNIPNTFSPNKTKDWIKLWYLNRKLLILKNIKEARSTQILWNKLMNNINKYKWYKSPKYLPQKIKSKAGKNDFNDGWINGMTLPDYKIIYFNNPTYPGNSIQIHEGTHSQEPEIQNSIIPNHIKLKPGKYEDIYLDDPDEINSRLMEFRYVNKLNPKRKYTIKEIKNMKNEGDGGTSWPGGKKPLDILDRYDNSTLLYLINDLAYYNNEKESNNKQYAKQGGMLQLLKKGSGIHIKEKNKGSFTRWCGGNVTSECILRGKNSSNPKIRKKATFADNARHFKHLEGGTIINQSPIVAQRMLWLLNLGNFKLQQELERMLKLLLKQQEIDRFNSMFNTFSDIGLTLLDKYLTKKNASPQQTNAV